VLNPRYLGLDVAPVDAPGRRHWQILLENRCFPASSAELGRCLTSGLPTPQGRAVRASATSVLDACFIGITRH